MRDINRLKSQVKENRIMLKHYSELTAQYEVLCK